MGYTDDRCSMGDDSAKKLILARRARFVAAALATLATTATAVEACGGDTDTAGDATDGGSPQPCLSPPATVRDAGGSDADAGPQPCLSPPRTIQDAGDDADADAGVPQPCLAVPPDGG